MKFAPKEIFDQILEWSVIPTFDLVIEVESKGYLTVKRKIAPYKDQWALPGLRMYKGESIDDSIRRIAKEEVGLKLNLSKKVLLGQYVGKFKTEHQRQDLSTGFYFKAPTNAKITINEEHFSQYALIWKPKANTGTMYKHYLKLASEL